MGLFSKWFSSNKPSVNNSELNKELTPVINKELIQSYLNQIFDNDEFDSLLAEAILEIVCCQLGEEDLLQRSFVIGDNRSNRIMDQMELVGIVGESKGLKPREVLVNDEKEILPRLKMAVEIHRRYKYLSKEESREHVMRDFEVLLSGISDNRNENKNISYKELNEEKLATLQIDENGFINYPNGVKLRQIDGDIYDDVIYETVLKLGYNSGELYFSNHNDEGRIERDYTQATCIAYWELFTDKLICFVRNDDIRVNYRYMRNCRDAMKSFYRNDAIYIRLKYGVKAHNISRSFLEKVFLTPLPISNPIDKQKIIDVLELYGIFVYGIKTIINKENTQYSLLPFFDEDQQLYDSICKRKYDIEKALSMPIVYIRRVESKVIIGFSNYSVNVDFYDYEFTFGGDNGNWLTDCLYDGYTMLALTDFIDKDDCYRLIYELGYMSDINEKKIFNWQAECYSKIDHDILNSKISIAKFSEKFGYDHVRINYIAMAAFYKQCDILQDIFIESTHGEYEIVSKTLTNGIITTKIRAYNEMFVFVNGHTMPESMIDVDVNVNTISKEHASGYIYVMVNPSLEGMVKIGKSTRNPNERVKELSSSTGVPTPFILVFYKQFKNCHLAEKEIHRILEEQGLRVNSNREFFKISSTDAIRIVQLLYDEEQKTQ